MASIAFLRGALAVLVAGASAPAFAGGFSRGTADTDILYEDAAAAVRTGVTYVVPSSTYSTIAGAQAHDDAFSNNYFVPSFAAKIRLHESFSCAATYAQPFGASATFGDQAQAADFAATRNATINSKFLTHEYGATCAGKFAAGMGNAYLIGGVFLQTFDYDEPTTLGKLHLEDDSAFGYRLGAAYEIPEYALRAQVLYRSEVEHKGDGYFALSNVGAAFFRLPAGFSAPVTGGGRLPKSLEVSLETGIAEGWLAYGSVKWTDWSVLPQLNYNIAGIGPQQKNFNFRDGWTIEGGVAHAFTDKVAGTIGLTWDRGVGTGADLINDTWTISTGTQIKAGPGAFRVGAGLSYMTAGTQSLAKGGSFDATSNGDWAVGLSTSYLIKF